MKPIECAMVAFSLLVAGVAFLATLGLLIDGCMMHAGWR